MTPLPYRPPLHHPCKDLCSGYEQGYEEGKKDAKKLLAKAGRMLSQAEEILHEQADDTDGDEGYGPIISEINIFLNAPENKNENRKPTV